MTVPDPCPKFGDIETSFPAVQPPDSLRERLLAEIARLEGLPVEALVGPWGEADRLRRIVGEAQS